jgi:hypothetical protein
MRWLPGAWVTLEWWVDDQRAEPPDPSDLAGALAACNEDQLGKQLSHDSLWRLCRLDPDVRLPPARLLLNNPSASREDLLVLHRLLGRSHMRMIPWETPF